MSVAPLASKPVQSRLSACRSVAVIPVTSTRLVQYPFTSLNIGTTSRVSDVTLTGLAFTAGFSAVFFRVLFRFAAGCGVTTPGNDAASVSLVTPDILSYLPVATKG